LYIFIGLGILLQWRNWSLSRWSYRSTQFELERDISRYQSANAVTTMVLLIEVGLVVFGIQTIVAPTLRKLDTGIDVAQQVITDVDFFTPTPGLRATVPFDVGTIVFESNNPADSILFTATPKPTPVGTIIANPPDPVGCDQPGATLQIPANGMKVFQITEVVGTAFTDNFAEYKLELKGPSTNGNFMSLEGNINPIKENASLGQFNPSPYEPGDYEFRVVVFDSTATMRASCTVNIIIEEPQPTRTPLAAP
ncbi:MAG TPA: hypothetical protein VHL11_14285, partial [Phototrophicaceae bacterium]|nr:hypothetical protein [Phototrophicaceae bacterium]